ncbi:pyridoxal kinase [Lentilactobacillus kefiri]|uniref:pyridoxal kinase n=4 Tax=Bacilli TaxID=91061 RepID=A0A511DVI2_LENKE|nr:pyridoxal kinase [Lentilactobacillus kefiri]
MFVTHVIGRMIIINSSVLIAEDFSAVGRLSATAAIAVFSAFGMQTATLPTEILSTQTEGFGKPETLNTDDWLQRATDHWNSLNDLKFNSGIVGYIGNSSTANFLHDYFSYLDLPELLIDPVLGDQGKMYDGFDDQYLATMQRLLKIATIITPNATELSLLSGEKLAADASNEEIGQAIAKWRHMNHSHAQVIVTGVLRDGGIGCVYMNEGHLKWAGSPYISGHFYGTGDLFSSLLIGYLNFDLDFDTAVQKAVIGVYDAVSLTTRAPESQRKFGLNLTRSLYNVAMFTLGQTGEEV